ncbi:hypothetical protein [Halobellus rubicundus]|uniref:Uncharacterized protein n=1 Tax=Halobellus rubicundus TaxID=2996466 RepID=A0ABD5MH95_9EURY
MPRSRRSLLEAAAATLGGVALASTTGCLGASRSPATATESPSPATPPDSDSSAEVDFGEWLPDPTATPLPDGYGVRYFDVDGIRARRDAMHPNAYDRLRRQMRRPVPAVFDGVEAVSATLGLDYVASLAFGSFDPDAFAADLTGDDRSPASATRTPTTATRTPWPEPERYGDFDIYGRERVYAVSPDAVLAVHPFFDGDAVACAKAIIDAPSPDTGQYADGNDYVASMLGRVDSPDALWCYPEAMDGSTSRGFRADDITGQLKAWRFSAEAARLTFANTYVDAETAESGELRRFLDSASARFEPYDGLEVAVDGRLAWTDGTAPIAAFDHLSAGGPADGVTTPN